MTDALNSTVPAGWYPDPWGSPSQRWWDGSTWTENLDSPPESPVAPEDAYTPVTVRATFEPATPHSETPVAAVSPFPSRRAMRELSATPHTEPAAELTSVTAQSLPPFTQAPEFSPEPVSALPRPVWTEPVEEPVTVAEPAPAEPAPAVPTAVEATPAVPTAVEPAPAESTVAEPVAAVPAPVVTKSATASAARADDGWAASLARWEDVETTSAPPDAMPIFGDSPPVSYSQRAMRYQPLHGRTSPVWLIVFIPLLQAVSVVGSMFLFPGLLRFDAQLATFVPAADPLAALASAGDWVLFALLPLTIAFFVFTFILGFQDRARLRLLGHDRTASPWWIVLSPFIYLIVRSVRVRQSTGRRGSGPLTTYICLYIAPALALIVAQTVTSALYGAIPA